MAHTILTMSRGDAPRLEEWVRYHARLGFDEFHVVLDNPVDDSESILRGLDVDAKVTVETREPLNEYYDGLTPAERWRAVKDWRIEFAPEIETAPYPINDSLSFRQYTHFPPILDEQYAGRSDGWLSLLDLDEFIVLAPGSKIGDLTTAAQHPRVRMLSFNMDTTGYDPRRPVLEQATTRWGRDDIMAYGKGWDTRVKSIVRYDAVTPLASVHSISKGPHELVDPEVARILHFKTPPSDFIPYTVEDRGALTR